MIEYIEGLGNEIELPVFANQEVLQESQIELNLISSAECVYEASQADVMKVERAVVIGVKGN